MDNQTPPPIPGVTPEPKQVPPPPPPVQPVPVQPTPAQTAPGKKPVSPWLWVGLVLVLFSLVAVGIYLMFFSREKNKHSEWDEENVVVEEQVATEVEEVPISATPVSSDYVPAAAETPTPAEEDGRGGFDDNAEGYFQQWANEYMTADRRVKFKGSFSNADGSWPIALTFDMDSNYFPGTCHYTNVRYGTKVTMSVRFTEQEMYISGNAGGSNFTLRLFPSAGGSWRGTAQNGSSSLNAEIYPVYSN